MGTAGRTRSTRCTAVSAIRRRSRDSRLPLQQKATTRSRPQSSQHTRTKPWAGCRSPRKARSSRSSKRALCARVPAPEPRGSRAPAGRRRRGWSPRGGACSVTPHDGGQRHASARQGKRGRPRGAVAASSAPATRCLQHARQGVAERPGTTRLGLHVHILMAATRSLNESADALATPHAHGPQRVPRAQAACPVPVDASPGHRHQRAHDQGPDRIHTGGGILRPALGTPSDSRGNTVTSADPSALYLAVHDVLCRVTAFRELRAGEAPSSCRPRAQVTGGCEERMGEPRNAEDLRGRPDKA